MDMDPRNATVSSVTNREVSDEKYIGTVTRIGSEPALVIEGMGEYRFAYRNVKKRRTESKPILALGDMMECRLTTTANAKAVALRLLSNTQKKKPVKKGNKADVEVEKEDAAPAPAVEVPRTTRCRMSSSPAFALLDSEDEAGPLRGLPVAASCLVIRSFRASHTDLADIKDAIEAEVEIPEDLSQAGDSDCDPAAAAPADLPLSLAALTPPASWLEESCASSMAPLQFTESRRASAPAPLTPLPIDMGSGVSTIAAPAAFETALVDTDEEDEEEDTIYTYDPYSFQDAVASPGRGRCRAVGPPTPSHHSGELFGLEASRSDLAGTFSWTHGDFFGDREDRTDGDALSSLNQSRRLHLNRSGSNASSLLTRGAKESSDSEADVFFLGPSRRATLRRRAAAVQKTAPCDVSLPSELPLTHDPYSW